MPIFCKNRKTLAYTFIHKYDNVESECQPVKQVIFLLSEKSSFHLRKSQFSWIKWLEEVYFLHKIFDKENGADFNMWLFNCCMKIMLSSKYQWIPLYINSFHLVIVLWVLVWSYGLHFFYLTVTNLYSTCKHNHSKYDLLWSSTDGVLFIFLLLDLHTEATDIFTSLNLCRMTLTINHIGFVIWS